MFNLPNQALLVEATLSRQPALRVAFLGGGAFVTHRCAVTHSRCEIFRGVFLVGSFMVFYLSQ